MSGVVCAFLHGGNLDGIGCKKWLWCICACIKVPLLVSGATTYVWLCFRWRSRITVPLVVSGACNSFLCIYAVCYGWSCMCKEHVRVGICFVASSCPSWCRVERGTCSCIKVPFVVLAWNISSWTYVVYLASKLHQGALRGIGC